jgi:c-di-GMP-binding flagellar brake protein YcgR
MRTPSVEVSLNRETSISPAANSSDRRRNSRKEIRLSASIHLPDGTILHGHTADVSPEGIGFVAPRALPQGHDCTLHVVLDACGSTTTLQLIGTICHCRKESETAFRIGMQFIRMDESAAAIIRAALT